MKSCFPKNMVRGGILTVDFCGDISLAYCRRDEVFSMKMAKSFNDFAGMSDYRIANLESPIISGCSVEPTVKESPGINLFMDEFAEQFVNEIDVDAYSLANNHMGDYGVQGICKTIDVLESRNREYVGASKRRADIYKPLRISKDGMSVSVFSVCEHEFGTTEDYVMGVAGFDEEILWNLIAEEKEKSDCIVVIFHGGTEFYPFPTPQQKKRYRGIIHMGADLVIGMHSHCPVGYEKYMGGEIFYGLGNLLFPAQGNAPYRGWYYGYIVRLILSENSKSSEVLPYYCDIRNERFECLEKGDFSRFHALISRPIQNDDELQSYFDVWTQYSGETIAQILEDSLYNSKVDINARARVKNLFSCEAHNELLRHYFAQEYLQNRVVNFEKKLAFVLEAANCEILNDTFSRIRFVFWGISEKSKRYINWIERELGNVDSIAIIDKDYHKQGKLFWGCRVYPPVFLSKVDKLEKLFLCTREEYWPSIRGELSFYGIEEDKVYEFYFERKSVNVFGAGKFGKILIMLINREKGTVLECLDNSETKAGMLVADNVKSVLFCKGNRNIPLVYGLYDDSKSFEMTEQCISFEYKSSLRILSEELQDEISLLPSREYLEIFYCFWRGEVLDFSQPKNFNQKMQYLKVYGFDEKYSVFADKYRVKQYVSLCCGEEYVIPSYGIWNNFRDIPFEVLPDIFVLKCTHDSGSVKIVQKDQMDIDELAKYFDEKLRIDYYKIGRETCYRDVPHRIMAEKYIHDENGKVPKDYKFFCFNGDVKYIQVDIDRFEDHRRNIYSVKWEKMDFEIEYRSSDEVIKKPEAFDEMVAIAKKMSKDIPFVRVDLYEVNRQVFFGEMTFYHGNGIEEFRPEDWNVKFGEMIDIGF